MLQNQNGISIHFSCQKTRSKIWFFNLLNRPPEHRRASPTGRHGGPGRAARVALPHRVPGVRRGREQLWQPHLRGTEGKPLITVIIYLSIFNLTQKVCSEPIVPYEISSPIFSEPIRLSLVFNSFTPPASALAGPTHLNPTSNLE